MDVEGHTDQKPTHGDQLLNMGSQSPCVSGVAEDQWVVGTWGQGRKGSYIGVTTRL